MCVPVCVCVCVCPCVCACMSCKGVTCSLQQGWMADMTTPPQTPLLLTTGAGDHEENASACFPGRLSATCLPERPAPSAVRQRPLLWGPGVTGWHPDQGLLGGPRHPLVGFDTFPPDGGRGRHRLWFPRLQEIQGQERHQNSCPIEKDRQGQPRCFHGLSSDLTSSTVSHLCCRVCSRETGGEDLDIKQAGRWNRAQHQGSLFGGRPCSAHT